jgi:hypothetical protein
MNEEKDRRREGTSEEKHIQIGNENERNKYKMSE